MRNAIRVATLAAAALGATAAPGAAAVFVGSAGGRIDVADGGGSVIRCERRGRRQRHHQPRWRAQHDQCPQRGNRHGHVPEWRAQPDGLRSRPRHPERDFVRLRAPAHRRFLARAAPRPAAVGRAERGRRRPHGRDARRSGSARRSGTGRRARTVLAARARAPRPRAGCWRQVLAGVLKRDEIAAGGGAVGGGAALVGKLAAGCATVCLTGGGVAVAAEQTGGHEQAAQKVQRALLGALPATAARSPRAPRRRSSCRPRRRCRPRRSGSGRRATRRRRRRAAGRSPPPAARTSWPG